MATPIYYPPLTNAVQKTLDAALLTGVTASATFNNVTGIQNKLGLFVVDRVDGNNNLTPNKREYISFAGTSGSTVTTLVRGLAGSTDQDHAVGAIVEFVNDVVQQQAIIDGLLQVVDTNGALDTSKVQVPLSKATGAELDTGTDDAKYATAKALKDSHNVPSVAPSTSGNVLTSDGTDWTSAAPAAANTDGWTAAGTFTYASATTITVASGAAAIYSKGDKIKLTQTTVKYFYIIGVADTVLTVTGGSNYTVANAAITSPYYSHQESPVGFPTYFNITVASWATRGTAFTNAPTGNYTLRIVNGVVFITGGCQTGVNSAGTGVWEVTFDSNQLPTIGDDGGGTADLTGSPPSGFAGVQSSVLNKVYISKYDGGTLTTGNTVYFGFRVSYNF